MPLYEVCCGLFSSAMISPIMTILDVSIIQSQVTKQSLKTSIIDTLKTSRWTGRPLGTMFVVYGATYSTANFTEWYCQTNQLNSEWRTLFTTSVVNIATIGWKDRVYANLFTSVQHMPSFPKMSYGLFALRDMSTIYASFVYKKKVQSWLSESLNSNMADLVSSLTVPTVMQCITSPLHFLALDIHQHPKDTHRLARFLQTWKSICAGRVVRVVPAFCVGGFINDMLRIRDTPE